MSKIGGRRESLVHGCRSANWVLRPFSPFHKLKEIMSLFLLQMRKAQEDSPEWGGEGFVSENDQVMAKGWEQCKIIE